MGKKSVSDLAALLGSSSGGSTPSPTTATQERQDRQNWNTYKRDHDGKDLNFEDFQRWQRSLENKVPFVPPTYDIKEFEQLPTSVTEEQTAQAKPVPQVINKYLEQVMSNLNSPTSGQTEVGKVLRAKSSEGV